MMTPFYVMCALWLVTLFAWMASEKKHSLERMEMFKLYKANSLTDYTVQEQPRSRQTNYVQDSIKRAYADLLGDDDD